MNNKINGTFAYTSLLQRHSIAVAAAFLLASSPLHAQWEIDPVVKVGGEIDDNPDIDPRTDQETSISGVLVEAMADFNFTSDRTNFSFFPRYLLRNYSDNPEFDSNDLYLRSTLNHRMRSSSFGFRATFDEQAVRTAERADADLTTEDPDEIDADDTGQVELVGDRAKWRFVPRWNYNISDVSSIGAQIDYYNVTYDDVFSGLLTDYTDTRLGVNWRRRMSSRNTFVLTANGRKYESEGTSTREVTGYAATIGLDHELSETTRVRVNVGMESTEQANGNREPEAIGDLTLTQNLETITMFAQYRRAVNASGAGQVSARDMLNVNFTRRLNEKISVGIGVRANKTTSLGQVISAFNDREYVQLRTQFIWFLSPRFSIETDYRYTVLDRGPTLDGRANSNRVNLWFVYQPTSTGPES